MRLLSFTRSSGDRRLGIQTDEGIRDLTEALGVTDVGQFLAVGARADVGGELLDPATVTVRAPLARPGKIICVGLNYHDHCREQSLEPPRYPMLFSKFTNAVADPGAAVTRPIATEKLDLECELGVVIGGSGQGEAISANKVRGARTALCHDEWTARLARQHNNANVLSLGARQLADAYALVILRVFLDTDFDGGRHQGRIDQVRGIEDEECETG